MTTHLKTQEVITKLGRIALPHHSHSPNLAPFNLFGALEDGIYGKRFGSDDEVTEGTKK
jgi:hypothetical protein